MVICRADKNHLNIISDIVIGTINKIYTKYYPSGAVKYFIEHHSPKKITADIDSGCVYILINNDNKTVGTVTINDNEINRLFVLPEFQGFGYGSSLLDFAEKVIFENYNKIIISASLPAKQIYLRRGYTETAYNIIKTDNGDFLCYDEMKKIKDRDI